MAETSINENLGAVASSGALAKQAAVPEQTYRLPRQVQEKDDDPDWQGNQYGATNCEDCEYNTGQDWEGGYPVQYSCAEMIDLEDQETSSLEFQFYYEATLPIDKDAGENVRALEWGLMNAVAERSGLTPKCNLGLQLDDENKRKLEGDHSSQRRLDALYYPLAIFSINRKPSDTYETSCTLLDWNPSKQQCLRVQSKMQVRFRGSDKNKSDIDAFLSDFFEKRMTLRPDSLRVKDVQTFGYLGDSPKVTAVEAKSPVPENQVAPNNGSYVLPTTIAASGLIMLGAIIFLFRSRNRSSEDSHEDEKDIEDLPDLEVGSTDTSDVSAGVAKSTSQSPSSSENEVPDPSKTIMAETTTAESDPPPLKSRASDRGLSLVEPALPFSASHDSAEVASTGAVVAGAIAPDVLPPRPPTRRSNSTKLKKRRKRKKKKKKVTLKRVNSRENINEMDTILESNGEEEGEDGSEYTYESGSEYSTEDDGSSNPSSGCVTPIRNRTPSHSRTSSRHSSPRLSPQDELFPSDVFSSDFEFFIEAPDFHFYTEKKTKLQPRVSQPEEKTVSPIAEEKKIRPLPPPWV